MRGTPAAGRLRAKTGTLDDVVGPQRLRAPRRRVRASPGSVLGQPIVFSLIFNRVPNTDRGPRRRRSGRRGPRHLPAAAAHRRHRAAAVTRHLPIFPLGSVLMPTQLLPLHIFEPRYRELMRQLTEAGARRELGVVLIERGHEVGGGDQRVGTGTLARLVAAEQLPDGRWLALFAGTERFRVVEWLPDDPFPQAQVEDLPEPEWDPADERRPGRAPRSWSARRWPWRPSSARPARPAGFELADDPARRPGSCARPRPSAPSTASGSWRRPGRSGWSPCCSRRPTPGRCLHSVSAAGKDRGSVTGAAPDNVRGTVVRHPARRVRQPGRRLRQAGDARPHQVAGALHGLRHRRAPCCSPSGAGCWPWPPSGPSRPRPGEHLRGSLTWVPVLRRLHRGRRRGGLGGLAASARASRAQRPDGEERRR